jgi:hypothetical protein
LVASVLSSAHPFGHAVNPEGHTQLDASQVEPGGQILPHDPQLDGLLVRSKQPFWHADVASGQTQLPALQL